LIKYNLPKRGRPLTFKVLMDLVQVNSERAIKHLIHSVKNMDIKNFDGESIIDAVAQLQGAHSRLKMVSFGASNLAVLDGLEVAAEEVAEPLVKVQVCHSVGPHLHQTKTIDAKLRRKA
jgi:hypothetical protein